MNNQTETNEELQRRLYLSEFEYFDGEEFITMNIVDINLNMNKIQVAVTNRGKISVIKYDLMRDKNGCLYFEHGPFYERYKIDDFEEV